MEVLKVSAKSNQILWQVHWLVSFGSGAAQKCKPLEPVH